MTASGGGHVLNGDSSFALPTASNFVENAKPFIKYGPSLMKELRDRESHRHHHHHGSPSDPCGVVETLTSFPSFSSTNNVSLHPVQQRHQLRTRPFKVILASTYAYFNMFLNWLLYYRHLCGADFSHIFFICLDHKLEALLEGTALQCSYTHYLYDHDGGETKISAMNSLWLARVMISSELLSLGYDVIMSDSDAVWLRNPFLAIAQVPTSHIVGSKATFPEEAYRQLGASLCMGFVYIKAMNGSTDFLQEVYNRMRKDTQPDDQKEINHMLVRKSIIYQPKPTPLSNTFSTGKFIEHGSYEVNVTLLPHDQFRRECSLYQKQPIHDSVVVHCLAMSKLAVHKNHLLKLIGLWALEDRWLLSFPMLHENYTNTTNNSNSSIGNSTSTTKSTLLGAVEYKYKTSAPPTRSTSSTSVSNGIDTNENSYHDTKSIAAHHLVMQYLDHILHVDMNKKYNATLAEKKGAHNNSKAFKY